MSNPTIQIFNAETNEVTEREMTDKETQDLLAFQEQASKERAAKEAQELARKSALAKLAALGLTEAEIAAL